MEKKRLVLYVALAYGLAWALWFVVVYPLFQSEGGFTTPTQLAVAAGMFAPGLAVVLTRLLTKEGFKDTWIVPKNFKRLWRYYVLAWFGPLVIVIAGAALYYLLRPSDFDPSMAKTIEAARAMAEAAGQDVPTDDATLRLMLFTELAAIPIAPLLNAVTCFGEEWGWRGYLLPKLLDRLSLVQALLVSGVIWGLWHAPITALGHNYGMDYVGYPLVGIIAMCLLCIVLGVFMSYVTVRTGSCLPAVFAHGMFNGCAAVGTMFSASGGNPFIGPASTGIIGGAFLVLTAALMLRDLKQNGLHADLGALDCQGLGEKGVVS